METFGFSTPTAMFCTNTEKILSATNKELDADAVEKLAEGMDINPIIDEYFEDIINHQDFPQKYYDISTAMDYLLKNEPDIANSSWSMHEILRPDVDARIMIDIAEAVISGVDIDKIQFTLDCIADRVKQGDSLETATNFASNTLNCMQYHSPISYDFFAWYSPEQLDEITKTCYYADRLINRMNNNFKEQTEHDVPNNRFRNQIFKILDVNDAFGPQWTPLQLEAIGKCVLNVIDQGNYTDIPSQFINDKIKPYIDVIKKHSKTSERMFDKIMEQAVSHVFDSSTSRTPEEIWDNLKSEYIDNLIFNNTFPHEIDNETYAINGLEAICNDFGFDEKTIRFVLEEAKPSIDDPNDSVWLGLYAIADMLVEGVKPEDVFDYLDVMPLPTDITLDTLYECINEGFPKSVTLMCFADDFSSAQMAEISVGLANGLSEDEVKSYTNKKMSVIDMCEARLKIQEEHEIENGGSVIGAKLNGKSELADKINSEHSTVGIDNDKNKGIGDD